MEKGKIIIEVTINENFNIVNDYLKKINEIKKEDLIAKLSNLIKYKII